MTAVTDTQPDVPPSRKSSWLKSPSNAEQRTSHVLPYRCIICEKDQWQTTSDRKRVKAALSTCEYTDGNAHRDAAELINDERISVQIRGKDMVAI